MSSRGKGTFLSGHDAGPTCHARFSDTPAAEALAAAGVSAVRPWAQVEIPCSYALAQRMTAELTACGGAVLDTRYGAAVVIKALVPKERTEELAGRVFDQSSGAVTLTVTGETHRAGPPV